MPTKPPLHTPRNLIGPIGRKPRLVALAALALLACATACLGRPRVPDRLTAAAPTPAGVTLVDDLIAGGVKRQFRLHVPGGYGGDPLPLVVSLHGFTSNAAQQERLSGASALADREGFFVVYPEGLGGHRQQGWQVRPGSVDVVFIRDLATMLQSRYKIDSRRIFVTGVSNGGGMVNRLACDVADLFAAAAPVAGAYLWHETCEPSRPVPVIAFHSVDDQIVPFEGSAQTPRIDDWAAAWAGRNDCTAPAEIVHVQDGVSQTTWDQCDDDATVVLYALEGSGHAWPGVGRAANTINATTTMWAFFKAHPKPETQIARARSGRRSAAHDEFWTSQGTRHPPRARAL